jgi:hypothetical protein
LTVDTTGMRVVSRAGAMLLAATAGRVGLDRELSAALRPWRRPLAIHDPGKVLLDLAISVAIGGDCLADIAQVRSESSLFGRVASDPTVSRLIDTLAADAPAALAAINAAGCGVPLSPFVLQGRLVRLEPLAGEHVAAAAAEDRAGYAYTWVPDGQQ